MRLKSLDELQTRQRQVPKKPPKVEKMPIRPQVNIAKLSAPKNVLLKQDIPRLDMPLAIGKGPYLGPGGAKVLDSAAMPLVRIEPQYPRKAAVEGKEGWVLLEFGINEVGQVYNVRVINSKQPRRIFNRAARRALLKWKYRPRLKEGEGR